MTMTRRTKRAGACLGLAVLAPACAVGQGAAADAGGDDVASMDASVVPDAAADATPRDARADGGAASDGGGPRDAAGSEATGDAASGCMAGGTQTCTTSCGSTGTQACADGGWGGCAPPAETCDLQDDDCNGLCDDVLGCRIGVDRSYDSSSRQHFYTTTDSEASCCGYAIEQQYAYYLYAAQQPGLVPFYRCRTAIGHLYTTDPSCAGQTSEGTMGWIATSAVCGSVPLYALHDATSGDHLYTTSSAESASAQSSGYTLDGTAGYVWPADCGGPSCTWPSPIELRGSTRTSVTGFPTAWYGFPIAGAQSFASLTGSVSVTNSANLYAEVLFILQYLPSGTCTAGPWPSSTPEYGPPGARALGQFIVKAPTQGTFTVPVSFTLPGGLPMSSCVLLGLNGGPVSASHEVVSAANLSLTYAPPQATAQQVLGMGGEFCFGQSWGCQAATTNDSQSFANVTPVLQASQLVALYGDISDSTFDGTSSFGAPPAGAWTATNDFFVYHGSECSSFGVASGTAGPGDYYASIPNDAIHLLSVPLSGNGIGVTETPVFQSFSGVSLSAGDCLVTLWGLQGGGGFDNETQVFALVR